MIQRSYCAGCGPAGPCQLGIATIERSGGERVLAVAAVPVTFEGTPGVAHGGWIAAVLTEVLGQFASLRGHPAATRDLAVRYRRPVPTDGVIEIIGHLRSHERGQLAMTAVMRRRGSTNALATAAGTWVERSRAADRE